MARSNSYAVKVHYPQEEEGMQVLRKKIGEGYIKFLEKYILELPISNTEKNVLYKDVIELLESNSQ